MYENNLIDDPDFEKNQRPSDLKIILSWEKRRLEYNSYLFFTALFCFILLAIVIQRQYIVEQPKINYFLFLYFFIGANICYCAAWFLELILFRLSIPISNLKKFRSTLFWSGTLFGIFLTFILFLRFWILYYYFPNI